MVKELCLEMQVPRKQGMVTRNLPEKKNVIVIDSHCMVELRTGVKFLRFQS